MKTSLLGKVWTTNLRSINNIKEWLSSENFFFFFFLKILLKWSMPEWNVLKWLKSLFRMCIKALFLICWNQAFKTGADYIQCWLLCQFTLVWMLILCFHIPLDESIDICFNKLFWNAETLFHRTSKNDFLSLLNLATK